MATTPAAGNLDEILELKLKALVFDEWDYEDFIKEGLSSYVEAIKRAFKDAGYMTGQEWYDKFLRDNTGIEKVDNVISREVKD